MSRKVLITTSTFAVGDSTPLEKLKSHGFEVTLNPFKRKLTKEESLKTFPGYAGLIAGLELLDEEVMSGSDLKVISRCGTGMANVDLAAAKRLNIKVCNTPDGPTTAVAELTLGCMLNLLRMISPMDSALHHKQWEKKTGRQLSGKTVVIVGFGRIGAKVARLLEGFGVKLITVDPLASKQSPYPNMKLEEALPQADIVTLHCSGEQCIISHNEFQLFKKASYLLNAARGGLVDETALLAALDQGMIAGAWLDAFSEEPYSGPLTNYPQVLLTPHVGSYTQECREVMENQAVDNLIKAFNE